MDWTEYWAKAKEREGKAIAQYLTVLQRVYPTARGTASVHIRPDHRIIVSVPLPKVRAKECVFSIEWQK